MKAMAEEGPSQLPPGDATTSGETPLAETASSRPAARVKRQELSLAERIEVIRLRDQGKTMREIANQFSCGKTQIMNIMSQRDRYFREWEENQGDINPFIGARKRRSRKTGNEETNRRVWEWYQRQQALGNRVTGPMLQKEAKAIAASLGIRNFAASNGWLDSFREFHNIGPSFSKTLERRRKKLQVAAKGSSKLSSSSSSSREVQAELASGGEEEMIPIAGSSGGYIAGTAATVSYQHQSTSGEVPRFTARAYVNVPLIRLQAPPTDPGPSEPYQEYAQYSHIPAVSRTESPQPLGVVHQTQQAAPVASLQPVIQYSTSSARPQTLGSPGTPGQNTAHHSFHYDTGDCHLLGGSPLPASRPTTLQRTHSVPDNYLTSDRSPEDPKRVSEEAAGVVLHGSDPEPVETEQRSPQVTEVIQRNVSSHPGSVALKRRKPGHLLELVSLAESLGLLVTYYHDELGNYWVELRKAAASFRVPLHGYRTHLARLIVDSHLRYWLEVVGHCISWGCWLSAEGRVEVSRVIPVLSALNGEYVVCKGRGSVLKRVNEYDPEVVIEIGKAENMYHTLPDYRFRSIDCFLWLQKSDGPRCSACSVEHSDNRQRTASSGTSSQEKEPVTVVEERSQSTLLEPLNLSSSGARVLPRKDGSVILHSSYSSAKSLQVESPTTVISRGPVAQAEMVQQSDAQGARLSPVPQAPTQTGRFRTTSEPGPSLQQSLETPETHREVQGACRKRKSDSPELEGGPLSLRRKPDE